MIGRTISHYKVFEKVGEGGMGEVFKAEDLKLKRTVALKFLSVRDLGGEEYKARFIHEAQAAAALDHPNICTVYEIDEAEGRMFMAMPFLEGTPLDKRIEQGLLPLDQALDIALQIAQGLQAAHRKEITHRDIKPSNVMVNDQGDGRLQVKIMDFGLARLSQATVLTKEGTRLGTAAYMSPEQVEGSKAGHRSDIWSLGVVLYEMVIGQKPFAAEYEQALFYGIIHEQPKPMTSLRTGVPVDLEKLVGKCLAKEPGKRYQTATDLLVDLRGAPDSLNSATKLSSGTVVASQAGPRHTATVPDSAGKHRWLGWPVLAASIALTAAVTWWLSPATQAPDTFPQYELRQLTFDSGLTYQPAISPDAKLIAYASDRAGEGNLDIWVQQVAGGEPIRLTDHESDDSSPDFSPDGSRIVFRSERDGGGIYVIPALGGTPRLLAERGRNPRYSPDGSKVAYWAGSVGTMIFNQTYVIPTNGGSPIQLGSELNSSRYPVWSPDSQKVLFLASKTGGIAAADWYVTDVSGLSAVKTGAIDRLREIGLASDQLGYYRPSRWSSEAGRVLFEAAMGDSLSLWAMRVSPDSGRAEGKVQRLTQGAGFDAQPSAPLSWTSRDPIVFASEERNLDVWLLPANTREGRVTGALRRLKSGAGGEGAPYIARGNRYLSFLMRQGGVGNLWKLDLKGGHVTPLTNNQGSGIDRGIISSDGSRAAYMNALGDRPTTYLSGGTTRDEELELEFPCNPSDWSSDDTRIACWGDGITLLDVKTKKDTLLARRDAQNLWNPRFSPDDKWIAFHSRTGPDRQQVFVIPVQSDKVLAEDDWIHITDGAGMDRAPDWSPDGKMLYFTSERDGFRCIWAQRLDSETKRPLGEPFIVQHFHTARTSLFNVVHVGELGLSIGEDKIVFATTELKANLWMMKPLGAQ